MGKHIVIHSIGSLGDLFPFLRIGKALAVRGHRVTIATLSLYQERVEKAGLGFHKTGPELPELTPELVEAIADPVSGGEYLHRKLLYPAIEECYADLMDACHGADLLVSGSIAYAAPIVAAMTGIRWVSTNLQPMFMFSAYDPPVPPPAPGLRHLKKMLGSIYGRSLKKRFRKEASGWAGPIYRLRGTLGLPRGGEPITEAAYSPLLHLALFSPQIGKRQKDWPRTTRQCGFVFEPGAPKVFADTPLPGDLGRFEIPPAPPEPRAGEYRGQTEGEEPAHAGSAEPHADAHVEPHAEAMREVLEPVPADHGQRVEHFMYQEQRPLLFTLGSSATYIAGDYFITAMEAAEAVGRNAILIGDDAVASWRLAGEPTHVAAFDYLPYEDVFGRASVIVHQGGIGTTAEALRAGVPQLVVPFGSDQYDNGERIKRLGCGLWVARDGFDHRNAPKLLGQMLNETRYATAARQTAEAIRAEDGLKEAVLALEGLLNPDAPQTAVQSKVSPAPTPEPVGTGG
ncbi:MAG: glycosyltransferase [Nitrospirota bacterium]|nr:glycosyltransferase [Nitrospirota bacterium]